MSRQTMKHRRTLNRRRTVARQAESVADFTADQARRAPYGMKARLQQIATAARALALQLGRVAR